MHEQTVDRSRMTLKLAYGLVPIIAGADKFTNLMTDWSKYLSPLSRRLIPVKPSTFMKAVGLIEMGAGALVLTRYARLGGYIVAGWLGAIAVQLLTTRTYRDVAVRDAVMALGALTLAKLTAATADVHSRTEPIHTPERPRYEPLYATD